jgi:hypothetical protein
VRHLGCEDDTNFQQEKILIIDLNPLDAIAKIVPPLEQQLPNESLKFWDSVTNAIVGKQYSHATNLKTEIEEKQRQKAAERKAADKEWKPRFFTGAVTPVGRPDLTPDGEAALKGLHAEQYQLEPNTGPFDRNFTKYSSFRQKSNRTFTTTSNTSRERERGDTLI